MRPIKFLKSLCLYLLIIHGTVAQRISEQKCCEYRRLTASRIGIIPLIAKARSVIFEEFTCPTTVKVIAGGEEAQEGEFPHHALLGWESLDYVSVEEYSFRCGAVLISESYVMTAGHCVVDQGWGNPAVVRLGEYDLHNDNDHHVDFDVQQVVRHPNYKGNSVYNDIALVKVKRSVRFSPFIRPACLWTSKSINFTSAIATGFGQLGFLTEQATKLNKVTLELYDASFCNRAFVRNRKFEDGVIDSQICAGSENEKDTCKGDSGGPLQVMIEGNGCMYYVVGLTSRGHDACGLKSSVALYTRVSSFVDWIEHVVWEDEVDSWK
ncbi:serine protease snake-like [Armigeres subalbatus]|uniref:serine protease snake-like n=1 Tax=Armigeres subalbatus TaxID=124917 RepID=UPI002ED4ACAC